MTENIDTDAMLRDLAVAQMQKSSNRIKSSVLLVALVEFVNSGDKTYKHFEAKYPVTVARLRQIVKANKSISGRVWPIQNDEFGLCLVNVTPSTPAK